MYRRVAFFLIVILYLAGSCIPAFAVSEKEKSFLSLYFSEDELKVVSTTRSLKSISRVAENVEVVTAKDMRLMNAHTLADVLNTVNGVSVNFGGASPLSTANISIEGSNTEQVAFFLDGVLLNSLDSNITIASDIPVQMIDKVEIIKGPASSVWGSSLGGVVNIITKSPPAQQKIGGMLSASYGERATADLRAEAAGKVDDLGFYLTAGRLTTNGLRAEEDGWRNNFYGKLTYKLSEGTQALFTLGYQRQNRERSDTSALDFLDRDKTERLFSTLSVDSHVSQDLDVNVSLRAMHYRLDYIDRTVSTGEEFAGPLNEYLYGASTKVTWTPGVHTVVFGADYDYGKDKSEFNPTELTKRWWAFYVNDTIGLGRLTITPGLRYDDANIYEQFVSPSLGMTYELADRTLLRAYVARGFNSPSLAVTSADFGFFRHNPDLTVEKVWSYEAGIESAALRYFWLKAMLYRHDIKNGITFVFLNDTDWTYVNKDRIRRQGVEFQMKTLPYYNMTLSGGVTFNHSEDRDTGEEIKGEPQYIYDLALKYDDGGSFSGLLRGRYVWFHIDNQYSPKYNGFIFDLNLVKTLYSRNDQRVEAFFTGHNIFDGSQYWNMFYKNAGRWVEAGLRYDF